MIENNIYFCHIPKTGGVSIANALGLVSDTKAQAIAWPQLHILRYMFVRFPCITHFVSGLFQVRSPLETDKGRLLAFSGPDYIWHMKAAAVQDALGKDTYARFKSVAVCRHPYTRAVSLFRFTTPQFLHAHKKHFMAFLDSIAQGKFAHSNFFDTQASFVQDKNGNVLVDDILRFETLDADWARFVAKHRLQVSPELPHLNQTQSHTKKPAAFYLDDMTKRKIYELYEEDFRFFGYEP